MLTAFALGFALLAAFPRVMVTQGPQGLEWIILEEAQEDPELVKAAQLALILTDYGPVEIDGVLGPGTRRALRYYQTDKELPVTGDLDEPTKMALLEDLQVFEAIAALARLGEDPIEDEWEAETDTSPGR